MRWFIASAAVVFFVGTVDAAVATFKVNRDIELTGHSTEYLQNNGGRGLAKVSKNYQASLLMDWDTGAINTWLTANPNTYSVVLNLTVSSSGTAVAMNVTTYVGNDWVEGTLSQTALTTVNQGTGMGTYAAANTIVDVDNVTVSASSTKWSQRNGSDITPASGSGAGWGYNISNRSGGNFVLNSVDYSWTGTETALSVISIPLDAAVVADLLSNASNRGIYVSTATNSGNNTVYQRNQAGGAYAPQLVFTPVPEPASVGLLGLLGGGLLLRRRREVH